MGIVQVIIDRTTSMVIEGVYEFQRDEGGVLVVPSGTDFPDDPVAGEFFWKVGTQTLYRRNDANDAWVANTASGLSDTQHAALRQLIHFIDGGPAEEFASGAYRETTGTVFPTAITWYDSDGIDKKKIVEKLISWSGPFPSTITWKAYDASETLLVTLTDTLSWSGPFETSRTRVLS